MGNREGKERNTKRIGIKGRATEGERNGRMDGSMEAWREKNGRGDVRMNRGIDGRKAREG